MKIKWLAPAIVLIVLVAGLLAGCEKGYAEQDMLEIAADSYELGRLEGSLASSEPSYDDGYYDGHLEGYEKGSMEGFYTGYKEGYRSAPLETTYSDGYHAGWLDGTKHGEATGFDNEYPVVETETMLPTETLPDDSVYIKAFLSNYSDDATPNPNGISLRVIFYDSKSKLIAVKGVPLTVTIKLYDLGVFPLPDFSWEADGTLIYQDIALINSTSESIRIPFEDLKIKTRTSYSSYHGVMAQVTVTTSSQGDFSATEEVLLKLYNVH